jgi:hypothetical protein
MSWIPIAIATGTFGGGSTDPDDPEKGFSKHMADECFRYCVSTGIVGLGWMGLVFATRKVFRYTPIRATGTQLVKKNGKFTLKKYTDSTFPEIIGEFTLMTSGAFGFTGGLFYTSYLIDRASYKPADEMHDQDSSC